MAAGGSDRKRGETPPANGDGGPGSYAREALAQWRQAARLGVRSMVPSVRKAALKLNPGKTEKGGKAGTAADKALAKLGTPGKLASKVALGSRVAERIRPGSGEAEGSGEEADSGGFTVPIQESVEVAVPVALAYHLCTEVEEFPRFSRRIVSAEPAEEGELDVVVKLRGVERRATVEIFDATENERIDWRSVEGIEHSGVITFHPLSPRLTHIEVSVDFEPQGPVERLTRATGLAARAVRDELHRFKAYAELYVGEEDEEFEPEEGEAEGEGEPTAVEEEELEESDEESEEPEEEAAEAAEREPSATTG